MTKFLITGGLLLAVTAPAFAAHEYYIIRGADKQCTVVEEKPTTSTTVIVGNKAYTTREEAQTQLKTVCAG